MADSPKRAKKSVSLADIAREVGVSKSTVSHAINDTRPISDPVKKRINEVIERLGYRSSYLGRALAKQKTYSVGVVVREITNFFSTLYLQYMAGLLAEKGYSLTLRITDGRKKLADRAVDDFLSGQADGMMVLTSDIDDRQVRELAEREYPVVSPGRLIAGHEHIAAVVVDYYGSQRQVMEYLYQLGHRKFGFIFGLEDEFPVRYRSRACADFLAEHKLEYSSSNVVMGITAAQEAELVVMKLMKQNPDISALVCSNDHFAVGAMAMLQSHGLQVPRDVSVIGYDDVPVGTLVTPKLTTVTADYRRIAEYSVENLVAQIESRQHMPVAKFDGTLVVRGSTGSPRQAETTLDLNPNLQWKGNLPLRIEPVA